ncbi:MAG TPA: type III pantothenate kinase [Flavobacteriaceae bacterium]|nr:type III pantothenate kinase [Flavobacteriaceae bacterium]
MNLIIDVGNTTLKWAVFNENDLVFKTVTHKKVFKSTLNKLLKTFPEINSAILSTVGKLPEKDSQHLKNKVQNLHVLNANSKLPFKNHYKTPKTLGVDRMALIAAASIQYPNQNVLVIDAGTCITFDFVTKENNYLGGSIAPGIQLRYKALHNLTANLPLLEPQAPESVIGNTTNRAIHAGVMLGTVAEIDGLIDKYKEDYSDLTVILTGGDTKFLSKNLKSTIFANSNFLLEGLNYILQLNSY